MTDGFDHFSGTREVEARLQFDLGALQGWIQDHVDSSCRSLTARQFKGGQSNPTYLIGAGERRWVLRRKPPGKIVGTAHAVDREYRVTAALAVAGLPVARPQALCLDEAVIGTAFYLMEYVEGRIFWDPTLPGLPGVERAAIFDEMNRVIAALHGVDFERLGLGDFGKQGNYFLRQIDRWSRQYQSSSAPPIAAMERLIEWLPRHVPPGDEVAIVHGDYRLDNIVFHPREPRILAVLDWELATLGHPLSDFAYHCLTWHVPAGAFRGLGSSDLSALSIPAEADYVAAYCRRVGRGPIVPDHWNFCIVFNLFRLAGILQGIRARVADGTAASPWAVEVGANAPHIAELAWQMAHGAHSTKF